MPLSPLERKAAYAHTITMRETTKTAAALSLGYSWTHVQRVMELPAFGSQKMKATLAEYCGFSVEEFWGTPAEGASLQEGAA